MTDHARAPLIRPAPGSNHRHEWRAALVMLSFLIIYIVVGARMSMLALTEPEEPQFARNGQFLNPVRGEILDRNGTLLASNLPGWALYANPRFVMEPHETSAKLAKIFPDMSRERLDKLLTRESNFVWIKRPITPRQRQAVLELGNPGLSFAAREVRVYPSGRLAAHVLGGVQATNEGVTFAELVGNAGIEHHQNTRLSDPARLSEPLVLSIDSAVQAAIEHVLRASVRYFDAKGGAATLMKVQTGEIITMSSLPDFDPNLPRKPKDVDPAQHPRFSRTAQGLYEFGSTFKPITTALAIDAGLVEPETLINTKFPIKYGRYSFTDSHRPRSRQSVTEIVMHSSNIGTIRMALELGTDRFREGLEKFGLFLPVGVELPEARTARPRFPSKWTDLTTITASFGHGVSVSQLHLAGAYATMANDGRRVRPTLLKGGNEPGDQVIAPRTSTQMMQILREAVLHGTGQRAEVPGYELGGKTGTAEKIRPEGGYYSDRVLSTFVGVFPVSSPEYVVVVSLDEPTDPESGQHDASHTAVPVTSEILRRVAPLLGVHTRETLPPSDHLVPVDIPVSFKF